MMKTAIVTGASGNLGREVVRKFIAEGYNVIGTVLANDPAVFDFPEDQFEKREVDLLNETQSGQFIESVIAVRDPINVIVLTVGGFASGDIAGTATADIMKQYRLNFETAYNIARPGFVQMMKQQNGRIFLIGSRPGLNAADGKGMIAYGLAKSIIVRLAEIMNEEAKGQNIVTSVIVPGTIDTIQNRKMMPDANFDDWVKPEAIASVIFYYCSEETAALRAPVIKVYGNS